MSLQKSLSQLSTSATDVDKHVNKFVKNETNVNVLRVVLIGYSLFISKIPGEVIHIFDYFLVRLAVSGMVAYLLFKDVITSLLLALCFILSIQELKKRNGESNIQVNSFQVNSGPSSGPSNGPSNGPSPNPNIRYNGSPLSEEQPLFLDSESSGPEDSADPAFQTLTSNLVNGSFTSDQQLDDAQSNFVQGIDPDIGVKTFVNQHGAQGLDVPLGLDPEASQSSAF